MIVEDSALMRRVFSDIIKSDSSFEVVALCQNGKEAYEKLKADADEYDVVITDILMPIMTGIELLEKIQAEKIDVIPIVISSLIGDGSDTLEEIKALKLNSLEFLNKPSNFIEARGEEFSISVLQVLHSVLGLKRKSSRVSSVATAPKRTNTRTTNKVTRTGRKMTGGNKLVAIACSTGGPKALNQVVPYIDKNINAPVVIVQHMPVGFTEILANKLNDISAVHVKEAEHDEILQKGYVYIAPGGKQLRIEKIPGGHKVKLTDEPAVGGLKPCADLMYESLENSNYDQVLCVVLTGMGSDGTKGITRLGKTKNIYVVAQNEQTCVVYGMPKSIFLAGVVDEVLPLQDIGTAISKNVGVR